MTHEFNDPTVDPQEVAYYSALADTWWDEKGPFWPLHRLNRVRTGYIRDRVCRHFGRDPTASQPLTGLRVLDIGCGGGLLSEAMARLGAVVHGTDVVARNIRIAQQHATSSGLLVYYENIAVEALQKRGDYYDVVLSLEVVEHVADLSSFMAACCALVHPQGMLLIATINRTWLAWLTAIIGAEYILGWLPKGTHRWHKLVKPCELQAFLRQHRFAITEYQGVYVNPLTRQMGLTHFTGVNYMLVAKPTVV